MKKQLILARFFEETDIIVEILHLNVFTKLIEATENNL